MDGTPKEMFPRGEHEGRVPRKISMDLCEKGSAVASKELGLASLKIAQEGGWTGSPDYNKDYRGSQIRSNVTKEKRTAKRKEKFEELEVAPVKDIEEHKVWGLGESAYTVGIPYSDGQVTEEPQEKFKIVMHLKMNVLVCAHPDYDWIGGLEVELYIK